MNVRRTLFNRVKQHLVDELYDRRIVSQLCKVGLFKLFLNFQVRNVIFGRRKVGNVTVEHLILPSNHFIDRLSKLLVFNNNGVGRNPRGKFKLGKCGRIRRVCNGHKQPVAAPVKRKRLVLANQCLWNKVSRKLFLNDSTQIKQRQPILFRHEARERGALDMAPFK